MLGSKDSKVLCKVVRWGRSAAMGAECAYMVMVGLHVPAMDQMLAQCQHGIGVPRGS